MAFGVDLTLEELPGILKPEAFRKLAMKHLAVGVDKALIVTRAEMVQVSSTVAVTGGLRQSWIIDPPRLRLRSLSGQVFSSDVAALVLDAGAKRHFPPVGDGVQPALGTWIRRKGIPWTLKDFGTERSADLGSEKDVNRLAYLIGRKFKQKRRPRRRIFSRRFRSLSPVINAILQATASAVAAEVNRR